MKTYSVIIFGKVQGVFFRDFTRKKALQLGIRGWVKNRPEGTVEALIQGDSERIEEMLNWFTMGSPYSHVEKVSYSEVDGSTQEESFVITY